MIRQTRTVALVALFYAGLTVVVPSLELWLITSAPDSALVVIPIIVMPYVALIAMLAFGSTWIVRATGDRDILLPALAWWLGWTAGNLVYWTFVLHARGFELMAGVISSATLGFLTPLESAMAPISLFSLGGTAFGLGFPWTLVIIYTAVLWNRSRRRQAPLPGLPSGTEEVATSSD